MTMTERLLEATKEIWDGYNETPFVKGIADGVWIMKNLNIICTGLSVSS